MILGGASLGSVCLGGLLDEDSNIAIHRVLRAKFTGHELFKASVVDNNLNVSVQSDELRVEVTP